MKRTALQLRTRRVFKRFLSSKEVTSRPGTMKYYESHLGHMVNTMDLKKFEDITEKGVIKYLNGMKTVSASTFNKRLSIIKEVLTYHDELTNFVGKIKPKKEQREESDTLSDTEVEAILQSDFLHSKAINQVTYSLLIWILVDTGARKRELLDLKFSDINWDRNSILLTNTKSHRDREVFFSDITKAFLLESLRKKERTYVFYNFLKGERMDANMITYLLKEIKKELKMKVLHCHMFRHYFATTMLEKTKNIYTVMQLLGHASVSTTLRYLHKKNYNLRKEVLDADYLRELKDYYPEMLEATDKDQQTVQKVKEKNKSDKTKPKKKKTNPVGRPKKVV